MAPVGTDPAPFLDWGGESRLVTSFTSPGPSWHGIGGMTEDYTKIGTALARGELAREPVPIATEESTDWNRLFSDLKCRHDSNPFEALIRGPRWVSLARERKISSRKKVFKNSFVCSYGAQVEPFKQKQ